MSTPNVTLRPVTLPDLDAFEQRFGFQMEGQIRRAQWRGGRWHDQLLLSLLRDERLPRG